MHRFKFIGITLAGTLSTFLAVVIASGCKKENGIGWADCRADDAKRAPVTVVEEPAKFASRPPAVPVPTPTKETTPKAAAEVPRPVVAPPATPAAQPDTTPPVAKQPEVDEPAAKPTVKAPEKVDTTITVPDEFRPANPQITADLIEEIYAATQPRDKWSDFDHYLVGELLLYNGFTQAAKARFEKSVELTSDDGKASRVSTIRWAIERCRDKRAGS